MSFLADLKRRNVIRSAIAYAALGWLIIEVGSVVFPAFETPPWVLQALIIAVAAGFVPAMILAWRYELTAGGVMKEGAAEVAGEDSLLRGRRFDMVIIGVLILALALVLAERLTLGQRAGDELALGLGVLPFENLSTRDEDAYLAGGMHEDVLTRLTQIPDLRVISRTTMQRIGDTELTIPDIGERLGVSHVLEGSVRRDGDQVRVTVQLIDAASDQHLWAENFDRGLSDLFQVQSEIALAIAARLQIELSPDTIAGISEVPTANPEAYALYLRAINQIGSSRSGLAHTEAVIGLLEQATALDPDFLQAKAMLANSLGRKTAEGDAEGRYKARALRLVTEIRERWPDHVLARRALGHYYYTIERDYERALDEYQAVVAVMPSDIVAVVNLRNAYKRLDRREEFLYWARRAVELSPESLPLANEMQLALLANGLLDEVTEFTRASVIRFPKEDSWAVDLADQHLRLRGDVDAYLAAAEELKATAPPIWGALGTELTWLYYRRGGIALAEQHLDAQRGDPDGAAAPFADMDHALLLRLEQREEEAQAVADRALAHTVSRYPVEEGGYPWAPANLQLAEIAAVAGDRQTAEAYRGLVDASNYPWIWLRAEVECHNGIVDALLGDAVTGWSKCEPYAGDPYLWVTREFLQVSAYHQWLFGDAPAFQAFISE